MCAQISFYRCVYVFIYIYMYIYICTYPRAPSYLSSSLLGHVAIGYIEPSSHSGNWSPRYVYIHIYLSLSIYTYVSIYTSLCEHINTRALSSINMYMYIYIHIFTDVCRCMVVFLNRGTPTLTRNGMVLILVTHEKLWEIRRYYLISCILNPKP